MRQPDPPIGLYDLIIAAMITVVKNRNQFSFLPPSFFPTSFPFLPPLLSPTHKKKPLSSPKNSHHNSYYLLAEFIYFPPTSCFSHISSFFPRNPLYQGPAPSTTPLFRRPETPITLQSLGLHPRNPLFQRLSPTPTFFVVPRYPIS